MKLTLTALVLAAGLAQAASVNIDCIQANASGATPIADGSAVATCGALATPGAISYNFVLLDYKYDASLGFTTGSVSFTHDVGPVVLNGFDDLSPQLVTEASRPYISSIQINAPSAALIAAINAGETITLSWTGATGGVGTVSGDFRWTVDYNTAVPEPTTVSLVGFGLVGLGLLGRRFKK